VHFNRSRSSKVIDFGINCIVCVYIMLQEDEWSINRIGYHDVGGCAKQMSIIKELVELPLRHPTLFDVIGIEVYLSAIIASTNRVNPTCSRPGGSVIAADCGVQVRSFGQWAVATCAAPPSVIASQYATSIVNRCWSGFPCKWQYINVETFNLFNLFNLKQLKETSDEFK